MTKLSVIIVTKNEERNIRDCLKSVQFADEIIVFDSSSTDNTVAICREYTPLVTVTPDWPGDGPQKNRALALATGDWVLCLDADERVSPELAKEMMTTLSQTSCNAFTLSFRSRYCSKPLRFGDWFNEVHTRLFRRNHGKFTESIVHCRLQVDGKIGRLRAPIIHFPFHELHTLLDKMNQYSTKSAQHLYQQGKKSSLKTALAHAFWAFTKGYCFKCGFLDGREGFLLAMSNAQGTYYRYLKLMYLWENHATHAQLNVSSHS
jgi:glycosyltransferase involved in cell wall biosynthesis